MEACQSRLGLLSDGVSLSHHGHMIQERRRNQRLIPDSPLSVYLDECGAGLLFDLSEGGLAVGSLPPKGPDQLISLSFNLPGGAGHIRGSAEIAWTSESLHRSGLRFLDLTDDSRQQLKEWISARAYDPALALPEKDATETVNALHVVGALPSSVSQERGDEGLVQLRATLVPAYRIRRLTPRKSPRRGDEGLSRLGKVRHSVGLSLAVVIFVLVFLFLGRFLVNRVYNPQAKEIVAIAKTGSPAKGAASTIEPPPAPIPTLPATLSFDLPGFVVQAGAMTHESNADRLRESLGQKGFPAFVFRHGRGRLYRVAVGPYGDADTAARVKEQLGGQGFEAIVKRWAPE
jgi:SPOR domain/PilZ domain